MTNISSLLLGVFEKDKKTLGDKDIFNVLNEEINLEDLIDNSKDGNTTTGKKKMKQNPEGFSFLGEKNISKDDLKYYKEILEKSFELFEFRNTSSSTSTSSSASSTPMYDCNEFLKAFREKKLDDPDVFYNTIVNSLKENPLGLAYNNIIFNYKNILKITEMKDIFYFSMSYLIQNPSQNYTAVIFVPSIKGSNQISTLMSRLIISGIFHVVMMEKIPLSEIIMIHSKSFYPEGAKLFQNFNKKYFIQFFYDLEILSPVKEHIFVPRITPYSKEEEAAFFSENRYLSKDKMKKIDVHKDQVLKYYGVRKGTLIKIERVEIFNDSSGVDVCFAYV